MINLRVCECRNHVRAYKITIVIKFKYKTQTRTNVERGLPAHRQQNAVGLLLDDDGLDELWQDWEEVDRVRLLAALSVRLH